MAYLDDHPPDRRQFYCPRRDGTQPSGVIVVHDAENATDISGTDTGAEAVANFIANRDTPGSYHDLVDSDSSIQLVRYECEAFHDATGTNRHSYGVCGAYRHSQWQSLPQGWRDACVRNMAMACRRYANWLKARRGIVIPAKRISVTQARNGVPGFISHAELDPDRRTDPGPHFPWGQFLDIFQGEPDDDMANYEAQLDSIHAQTTEILKALRFDPGTANTEDDVGLRIKRIDEVAAKIHTQTTEILKALRFDPSVANTEDEVGLRIKRIDEAVAELLAANG
jgi:hypothetical protein